MKNETFFDAIESPLKTANFDYFRLPPESWNLLLLRLAQLGFTSVILPVPWRFHHLQPDQVDVQGNTSLRRNLAGLLELCAALNLTCLLHAGPTLPHYGLLNDGRPDWLPPDGSEEMQRHSERWQQALHQLAAPFQWPAGPLVGLIWTSPPAKIRYSDEITQVRWPIWLRKRYQGMTMLNEAYGSSYRSVNEVKFPADPAQAPEPLATDVAAFLAELPASGSAALTDGDWQIPVFEAVEPESRPVALSMALTPLDKAGQIVTLAAPIDIDAPPADISQGLVWAAGAPIKADGSVRRNFWAMRQHQWPQAAPMPDDAPGCGQTLEQGGLLWLWQDTEVKLPLPDGSKPSAYRLQLDGRAAPSVLTPFRGKLRGLYLIEEAGSQTDLLFYLDDPDAPLPEPLAGYLGRLLAAQQESLRRAAAQSDLLTRMLTPQADAPTDAPPGDAGDTARAGQAAGGYTLNQARQGLSQAEAALRKAMASIGGLETGFETILGRGNSETPPNAPEPVEIRPEIFDPSAQARLADLGQACQQLGPALIAATEQMAQTMAAPLTLAAYQTAETAAAKAAYAAQTPLLAIIAHLRQEIATEQLPLVTWRLHNQAQSIARRLAYGVLRNRLPLD